MSVSADPKTFYDWEAAAYWAAERRCHDEPGAATLAQRVLATWTFELIGAERSDVQAFAGLLIMCGSDSDDHPLDVLPDLCVFVEPRRVQAASHYLACTDLPQPVMVMLHKTRREGQRFEREFKKYERGLRSPYCLAYDRDNQELSLFKYGKKKYKSVKPNEAGRFAVPELEVEAAILDGWVRFWFRGVLVPPPGELVRERNAAEKRAAAAEAELAKLREELARLKGAS